MSTKDSKQFAALSQPEKNDTVRELARETGGMFRCYDVVGSDGIVYTAFERQRP